MNGGQASQKNISGNNNSQDVSQSYQPEEGSYYEQQEQQKHDQTVTERGDRPSQDVTEAPEES